MPALKLTYFNLRARAEPARLILKQAGVEFEDCRLPAPWDDAAPWTALKPVTPFGVLPLLCVDGTVVSQSRTIARYLAHEHGLAGANALENAQMDEIVDALADAIDAQYAAYLFEKDETKKAQLQKDFNEKTLPPLIKNIERRLTERGGEYLVGGKLSWADICVYHFATELPDQTQVKASCKVSGLVQRVGNQPNIKKWVDSRPETIC